MRLFLTLLLLLLCPLASAQTTVGGVTASGVSWQPGVPQTVATPTFTPDGGSYGAAQDVVIASATPAARLCYTTNGATPTAAAGTCTGATLTYYGAVHVVANLTLQAIGSKSGYNNSGLKSAIYAIGGGLAVATTTLPNPTVGQSYAQDLQATGGTLPYIWTISTGSLPAGLSLNSSTGTISGIPTNSGPFNFTAKVTDSAGGATAPIAYVTSRENDNLSVIDTASNTLSGVVPSVGVGPYRSVITPNGRFVYNTNGGAPYDGNTVTVTDTHTNNVLQTITTGTYPLGIAMTPDGSTLYVANRSDLTVSVISTATNTVTGTIGPATELSTGVMEDCTDGIYVYVTNKNSSGRVHFIRVSDNTLQGGIAVGNQPFGCAYNPVRKEIWVANGNQGAAGTISVIDADPSHGAAYNTVIATIASGQVGYGPDEIAFTPDGLRAYVTLQSDGSGTNSGVAAINAATRTRIGGVIAVGGSMVNKSPNAIAVAGDGLHAYATIFGDATGNSNVVSVIDSNPASGTYNTELSTITAGGYGLNSIAIAPVVVGNSALKALSLQVNAGPPSISSTSPLPNGTAGTAYAGFTFRVSGGTVPFTWSTTAGSWPAGLSMSPGGVVSGTPSAQETETVTVQVADSLGGTDAKDFTITIAAGSGGGTGTGTDPLPTGLGWHQLPGTALSSNTSVCDTSGNLSKNSGRCDTLTINDWNGATMVDNPLHHWMVWGVGGGHDDYYGNELYAFDLSVAPYGKVKRLNNQTPQSSVSGCSDIYSDGRPDARHDYGGIEYDSTRDQLFLEGGAHACINGGQEGGNTWALPLSNAGANLLPSLAYPGTTSWNRVSTGGPTDSGYSYSGDFDPASDMMWWKTPTGIYTFNFTTSTWTKRSNYGGLGNYTSSVVVNDASLPVAVRHLFISLGMGYLEVSDITNPASVPNAVNHAGNSGCSTPAGYSAPGIAYDPVGKQLVVYGGSGATFYTIDFTTNTSSWTCTAHSEYSSGVPGSTYSHQGGMWGWFSYSPYCDCFVTENANNVDFYILRLRTPVANNFGQRSAGVNTPGGSGSVFNSESLDAVIPAPPTDTCRIGAVNGGRYECFTYNGLSNVLSRDCSTSADGYQGDCSLHWAIPSGVNTNAGELYINFSPDFSKVFGQGQEFYYQFRVRYDANVLNSGSMTSGTGTKIVTTGEGDSAAYGAPACDNYPGQITIVSNTGGIVFPTAFVNCGDAGGQYAFTQSPYQSMQIGIASNYMDQVASGCPHYRDSGHASYPYSDPNTDDTTGGKGVSTCWNYTPNEWFTVQGHVKVGTWNSPNSVVEFWFAHEGKPARLLHQATDAAIPMLTPPTGYGLVQKYGKLKLSPYTTGGTWNNPVNLWYDDIIFSTRRIPDPGVATPNEPDSLSISVTNHVPTISWRVNSQNGTAQDDAGFYVERCTGGVSSCMPSPQSGFNQIGSPTTGASSYVDNTAVQGTTYTYRVRAHNAAGNSGYAASVCFNSGNNCGGTVTP